jgi:hypothetical protein
MFGLRALWIDCLEGCKDAARVFHKQLKENNCEIPTLLENVHSKLKESCSGQNIRFFPVSCSFRDVLVVPGTIARIVSSANDPHADDAENLSRGIVQLYRPVGCDFCDEWNYISQESSSILPSLEFAPSVALVDTLCRQMGYGSGTTYYVPISGEVQRLVWSCPTKMYQSS